MPGRGGTDRLRALGAEQTPPTPHEARWSLPVVFAARMAEGPVDLATFEAPLGPCRPRSWRPAGLGTPAHADFPRVFEAELSANWRMAAPGRSRSRTFTATVPVPLPRRMSAAQIPRQRRPRLDEGEVATLEMAVAALDQAASLAAISDALRRDNLKQRIA